MEKLSQLPLPLKKSPQVDVRHAEVDMTSAHGSRSVSESSRGRANSSSRSSSSSCNSALQSFVNGCRSPRKTGCSSAGRLHPDDYVIAASIGNRRSSTVLTSCDSPSPVDRLGGRVVGTSSCGDCTPEVSRRVVEETGNRKNKFSLRDSRPKTSTAGFNSQTAENEGQSVLSRLTDRHPTKTINSTLCPSDLQANFQLDGGTNCYKASDFDPRPRTISPRARSSATRPYLEPTFGDHRRNCDDIVTYQRMATVTSIHVEQRTDDYGPLRGDSPPTPSDAGDVLLKQRCETNTGNGSNGGGSPIYHELDPPGGVSTGDGVYKFPQSSSSVQHTYQSIAEISEELNTLRSKSVEQVARLNNIKRAENIDKRAKNLSIDDQLLIGSCSIKNTSSSLKKKQQLQQLTRGPLSPGPMSSGATRVMRDEMVSLTRAKSVQDLGQRGATAGISATQATAAAPSSSSSGLKKQSTPKLSIFSRIRFTKKSPSKGSSNHATATTVNGATTLAGSSIENFNPVPGSGHGAVDGPATASASLDNSRNEPSFSTFTGGTSTHRGVTADRLERDSTAPPDEPYSAVYAPRRVVVPPPRNSSLSPASDGRRARLTRDVARPATRDVPSPAGVVLSVSPSPNGASVTTGNELPAEPLYKQKFLKIASSSATLHCANSLTVQQSAVRIHNSNSLGNLPLVATSSDLHSSRSPAAGPLTGGSILPLRAVSGSSMTPEMATVCRLAALTPSGSDYSMSSSYVTSGSAFSYDIYGSGGRNTGVDDYLRGDATPPRSRKIVVGGVQRAAGLSPSRVVTFARPSCGVRMAEMRVVARRLTAVGESSGTCSSEYTACPSPRWVTSNHVPTPIPSPGLAGNRRIPVFQFHFPADNCSSGCSSPTQSVREYRDQSSQTQINVDPISEVRSSDALTSKSDGLMLLSAVGSGPSSRRQMQTIEEEENIDSPEIPNVDKSETVDGDSTARNTAVESVVSSEPTPEVKETSHTSRDSASVDDVPTASAGISIMPASCTPSSVAEAAHVPAESEISSTKSSTKLKLPSSSSSLSVSSGSPLRASRRPLAERTTGSSTAASDAPSAETVRLSQSTRTAASPSSSTSTTPTSRRRGDVTNGCGGGGDQTPTRRRTISTGNSRISRSPAAASSRSETVTDGSSAVSTRARAGSIGSAVSSGHFVPPSTVSCVRGHAPTVGDRRRQANDGVTTSSQHGGGRQRNDVASSPGVGRPSMSDATTVMAEPIEGVVSVRSRVAAWSKPTTVGCSSASSSSDGSLASAGADSESDGMPGLTSDPPDLTTRGDHLSKVTLGGRKLLTDKSDQSYKENRLANALMRVEQGTLSEKTRMLLAKISVARSAANDIDRESGTHIMNQ